MEINKKSSYKSISIMLKNDPNKIANGPDGQNTAGAASLASSSISSQQQEIKMSKNETDLN